MKPTTWFTPLDRPPFVQEHHAASGPPANLRVLEISSRSDQPLGRRLSAMFLKDPETGKPVESVYQAAKCYGAEGGPAGHVLDNGFDAKRFDRERSRGARLRGFQHGEMFWPASTGTQFYDRLWMQSARAADVGRVDYDAFTDVFHRRGQTFACQARSMAMMQGMIRAKVIDRIDDPMAFSETMDAAFFDAPKTSDQRRDEIRIAVTGSQRFADADVVRNKLDDLAKRASPHPLRLIHGGQGDLDAIVEGWASETGTPTEIHRPDWEQHPHAAGYRANEEILAEHDPHMVVSFPDFDGKLPRHLVHEGRKRHLEIERVEIDGDQAWTHTPDGELADLQGLGNGLAATKLHAKVEGPSVLAAARLANGHPGKDGEIRVVVAPGPGKEDAATLRAHLDGIRERSAPAALRLAFEESVVAGDAINIAHEWARNSGVRCDMYLRKESGDSSIGLTRRILAEQDPHLMLAGRRMPHHYAVEARAAAVPLETVTATGWLRTSGTKPADLGSSEARRRGHADPTPGVYKPYQARTAASVHKRLGGKAADAPWAQPDAPDKGEHRLLNLRDDAVWQQVRDGGAVRIDRKTKWGNPIVLRDRNDADERREVINDYRQVLAARIDSGQIDIDELAALDGKPLACHCAPKPCHGGPLGEAARWATERLREREPDRADARPKADERVDEALGVDEINVDDIPPWDDSLEVEPTEAVAQHAFQTGMSSVDAINRRRDQLERNGADEEQLRRYDDAVLDFEGALLGTPSEDEEIQRVRAAHPDAKKLDALDAHAAKLREAGASKAQLERIDETKATIEARIDRSAAMQELAGERRSGAVAYMMEKLGEPGSPLEVARAIEAELNIDQGERQRANAAAERERSERVREGTATPEDSEAGRKRVAELARQKPKRSEPLNPPAAAPRPAENTREVRVMVCGGRSFHEANLLRAKLDEVRQRIGGAPMRVVTGDSQGADKAALKWCEDAGVPCDVYEADWEASRGAGYQRNERMIEQAGGHVLVAFPRDEFTPVCEHLMVRASEAGMPIETVDERGITHTSTPQLSDLRALGRRKDDETRQVEGEQLETIDPVEYAARISTMRELGDIDDIERALSATGGGDHEANGPEQAPSAAGTASAVADNDRSAPPR